MRINASPHTRSFAFCWHPSVERELHDSVPDFVNIDDSSPLQFLCEFSMQNFVLGRRSSLFYSAMGLSLCNKPSCRKISTQRSVDKHFKMKSVVLFLFSLGVVCYPVWLFCIMWRIVNWKSLKRARRFNCGNVDFFTFYQLIVLSASIVLNVL